MRLVYETEGPRLAAVHMECLGAAVRYRTRRQIMTTYRGIHLEHSLGFPCKLHRLPELELLQHVWSALHSTKWIGREPRPRRRIEGNALQAFQMTADGCCENAVKSAGRFELDAPREYVIR
jgi:hypothetical protein